MWKVFFRSPLVCNEFYALYFSFFIVLHSFSLYWGLGNFKHHGVSSHAHHSDLFYASVLNFGFWHAFLYSLLSYPQTTENTQSFFLLPRKWSNGLGHTLSEYMLKVPEGAVICFLKYADTQVRLPGLLLTCTSLLAEMQDPVLQSNLR